METLRKCIGGMFLAGLLSTSAWAATITLNDGRVFTDAKIVGQSPRTVMIRHADGLASVPKSELPADLRKEYPETPEPVVKPKPTVAPKPAASAVKVPVAVSSSEPGKEDTTLEKGKQRIQEVVLGYLPGYFQEHNRPMGGNVSTTVQHLSEPVPVPGWAGRWRLSGSVVLAKYKDLDPLRAEALLRDRTLSNRERERIISRETSLGRETVEFEIEVTNAESEAPSFSVTIR